jgi:hypothetical protein
MLLTGDRGVSSATTELYAQRRGGAEEVLPKPGKQSATRLAYARQEWFRAGRNWRAGIEGRISGLQSATGWTAVAITGPPGRAGRGRP